LKKLFELIIYTNLTGPHRQTHTNEYLNTKYVFVLISQFLDFRIPVLGQILVFQVQHQYRLRGRRRRGGGRGHGGDGQRVRARRRQFEYALHVGRGRRGRRGRRAVVEQDVRTQDDVLVQAAGVLEAHAATRTRVLWTLVAAVLPDVSLQTLLPLVHLAAELTLELLGQQV